MIIKNQTIELVIDENRGEISSLKYKDREFIGATMPIFEIALRSTEGNLLKIDTFSMTLKDNKQSENKIECIYEGNETVVNLSVTLTDKLSWEISVKGIEGYAIEWVKYPIIAVPDDFADHGGTSKILWGFNEGTLIENMDNREIGQPYFEPEYPCIGVMGVFPAIVETQFMAYFNEISGMYIASHDNENNLKAINPHRENDGVLMEFRHYAGCEFGEDYTMPYPMVIEFFHGDWQNAAEIYRQWFKAQEKEEFIPIKENKKLPKWYGESPVIVTYPVRGKFDWDEMTPNKLFPYINVMPHVKRLEEAFNSKIMILLMHWEGTAPWAPPVVWPPYGGEEELKKLIDALHERGDLLGVYCSGLGWTINSNVVDDYNTQEFFDKENLKEEMCISPQQTLEYSRICTMQRSGYDMCPTRDFTKNIVKEQVQAMVDANIDYIQLMDQNHGGTSYFCYSREHGHAPVPGKWQVDAVKELLSDVNEIANDVLIGCESAAAESYIPNLLFSDNRFNLAYFIGRPVPVYAYIYHEYLNNFLGNQVVVDHHVDMDKSPEAFFERIAYSFSAGDMLTVVITEDGLIDWNWGKKDRERPLPDQENAQAIICNLNAWRIREKQYLHTGSMIKPLEIDCGVHRMWRCNGSWFEVPVLHTSAWMAENGTVAQFVINYNSEEKECLIDFGHDTYQYKNLEQNGEYLTGKQTIKVPPFAAIILEKQ